jgi:hypothetical protein
MPPHADRVFLPLPRNQQFLELFQDSEEPDIVHLIVCKGTLVTMSAPEIAPLRYMPLEKHIAGSIQDGHDP